MNSSRLYQRLPCPDSIRLLELTRQGPDNSIRGHLVQSRLDDTPRFAALSYVWGCASPNDPTLQVDGFELRVRQSLAHALDTILSDVATIMLWIDQICIDQENDLEREHQVKLMWRIFKHAQRVVCWLGPHEEDVDYAFDLLKTLVPNTPDSDAWKKAAEKLSRAGYFSDLSDLFDPTKAPFSVLAALVNRPWFSRLWIVQEVALASELEFRCGGTTIEGRLFFAAFQTISSIIHDPPMPWLLKPFRHAVKLGQLRAQVAAGRPCSYPHLAQAFSTWDCKKSHDRLNALFGLVFLDTPLCTWFQPSYSMTGPDLFMRFAKDYIKQSGNLDVLHFAGCGDAEKYSLSQAGVTFIIEPSPPADDVPSWAPDWRVQSRPLVLLPYPGYDAQAHFAATTSKADYCLNENCQTLRVRALLVDEIVVCGPPYHASLCKDLQITDHEIFGIWYELAKSYLNNDNFKYMFTSTLVMDARVTLAERGALNVQREEIATIFRHWVKRSIAGTMPYCTEDSHDLSEGSARFGYVAEEVCRNRTFFVTKNGRLGLGSTHVSPGAYIYLLHGLGTPFVIHTDLYRHRLRGKCYVHGLMDQQASVSDSDVYLNLI
jgi:hypothetical protein